MKNETWYDVEKEARGSDNAYKVAFLGFVIFICSLLLGTFCGMVAFTAVRAVFPQADYRDAISVGQIVSKWAFAWGALMQVAVVFVHAKVGRILETADKM